MGGSASRIKNFAFYMLDQLELKLPTGQTLVNLIEGTDRYVMYKTGPVLCVNVSMAAMTAQPKKTKIQKHKYNSINHCT